MKRFLTYALSCLLLAGAACSKDNAAPDGDNRKGVLAMTISTSRAQDAAAAYDPMDHLTVYIYNSEGGLLRKYTSKEAVPARLELLAGTYRVAVEAGEAVPASFSTRLYTGENTFVVKAGETTDAEVVCKPANTVVEVKFDDTVAGSFEPGYYAWVTGDDAFDEQAATDNSVPALKFTEDGTGYYTLPEGTTSLAWKFSGVHSSRGAVSTTGAMDGIKAGGKYVLTFKYSPDLPGFIDCLTISVNPDTDDKDDTIIFKPEPTIEGDGFVIGEVQRYISGERSYRLMAFAALENVTVRIDGQSYDALNGAAEGISVVRIDDYNLTLTLSEPFFDGRAGGDHNVEISLTDANGGSKSVTTPYRLQGLVPVTNADYDLWNNTVTLRAVAFDTQADITFGLCSSGTDAWQTLPGTPRGNDFITATFQPGWQESQNAAGLTIYTPAADKGIFATRSYDYKATINGAESKGSFTAGAAQAIPGGDMEDGTTPCFILQNASQTSTTWGSGNNKVLAECWLCRQVDNTFTGTGKCAMLTSGTQSTIFFGNLLTAGNLFFGQFSQVGTGGDVRFGQKYAWEARPTAMRVSYQATVGMVDYVNTTTQVNIPKGNPDKALIFVAIVDWEDVHTVTSTVKVGTGLPATVIGSWNPENTTDPGEGKIIGYGTLWIDAGTTDWQTVDIPINYYDKKAKPAGGNYSLVISCACNAYGEYFNGCSTNVMYVDDFEWVY